MTPLKAFVDTDFDWTVNQTGVWRDLPYDVSEVHEEALTSVFDHYARLEGAVWSEPSDLPSNPLGAVVVGQAGVGKTHLMGRLRREVIARGGTFVLADLTDVRDFWDTALQGAVSSLTRRLADGTSQLERVINAILRRFGQGHLQKMTAAQLGEIRPPALLNRIDELVRSIQLADRRRENVRYGSVLRALLLLASSEPNILQLGEAWMSGLDVREESQMVHALPPDMQAMDRLVGVIWWAHFHGPTLVAVDQIDAIASEARAAELAARTGPETIFARATNGLMGLWEKLPRTQVVLSCLETNWGWIQARSLESVKGRFDSPILLKTQPGTRLRTLIERRLAATYAHQPVPPPYPSYPFQGSCFDSLQLSPRAVLRRAEDHRRHCQRLGRIEELQSFPEAGAPPARANHSQVHALDADFTKLRAAADPQLLLQGEDSELDGLLEAAVQALAHEQAGAEHLDVELDLDFGRHGQVEPLHARIRVIDRADGDREKHLSLRFIQQDNAIAVQTRVRKAMTESGLGQGLGFRRLTLLRRGALPSGPATQKLLGALEQQGGAWVAPEDAELRTLAALQQLLRDKKDGLHEWLAANKPVSQLPCFEGQAAFLFAAEAHEALEVAEPPNAAPKPEPNRPTDRAKKTARGGVAQPALPGLDVVPQRSPSPIPRHPSPPARVAPLNLAADLELPTPAPSPPAPAGARTDLGPIRLGETVVGVGEGEPVHLHTDDLTRHVALLAAAGSGKTVLLKRIVEEAACRGIPSLVIDVANDLARLGERWPSPPEAFNDDDRRAANAYFSGTETVVWTPGWGEGNPLSVDPLPDFGPLLSAPDELAEAQTMARELLAADLNLGKSAAAQTQRAILQRAIEAYARSGGQSMQDLLQILREPGALVDDFADGARQSARLADTLTAQLDLNPMLKGGGAKLDFGALFGDGTGPTRISVVNLGGLPTLELQQAFVARLATLLFTHVKKSPGPANGLGGLVVIDEAKDFVPAGRQTASSQPILRLAAQLRKYRFGLLVATQEPKSIDHKVVANCSTQLFGRALSPAAQDAVKAMMSELGGSAQSAARLQRGQFYASVPTAMTPRKIRTRLCLSHHGGPLAPDEIRARAAQDRERLRRG